jgi:hypothetical protein
MFPLVHTSVKRRSLSTTPTPPEEILHPAAPALILGHTRFFQRLQVDSERTLSTAGMAAGKPGQRMQRTTWHAAGAFQAGMTGYG